jgi:hypothetical protein
MPRSRGDPSGDNPRRHLELDRAVGSGERCLRSGPQGGRVQAIALRDDIEKVEMLGGIQ